MSPKLLLFDIDGTILKVDEGLSRKVFLKVFSNFFNLKIDNLSIDFDFSGLTDLNILYKLSLVSNVGFKDVEDNLEILWKLLLEEFKNNCHRDNIHLVDGVVPFINTLLKSDKIYLGLLTGNFKDCAYYKLELCSLNEYFPFGAFGDESIDRSKLHSLAISRFNDYLGKEIFSHSNTFVIGDSVQDIISAKKNGIKVIAIATGKTNVNSLLRLSPDILIESFSQSNKIFEFLGL